MNFLIRLPGFLICLLLACILKVTIAQIEIDESSNPILTLSYGKVKGKIEKSRNGREYYQFLGIPYAKVNKRFEDSIEVDKWNGVKDGSEFGPFCIQADWFDINNIMGEEDCTNLNIFVPKGIDVNKKMPVLFFIHGGGFRAGTANWFRGKLMMDEDVILVSVNHRLGPLGFLNINGEYGNMGLKDLVMALKFVNKEIGKIGGNKEKITVTGVSAGGAASHLLAISPMSKDLFNNAILHSGSALAFWAHDSNPDEKAKELAKHLNCPTIGTEEIIKCLQEKTPEEILKASNKLFAWYSDPLVIFTSSIEKERPGKSKDSIFLSKSPYNIIKNKNYKNKDMIVGVTKDEGVFCNAFFVLTNPKRVEDLNSKFFELGPKTFMYEGYVEKSKMNEFSQKLKKFYFGDKAISLENKQGLVDLYSDALFLYSAKLTAKLHAKNSEEVKIFPFVLDQKGEKSIINLMPDQAALFDKDNEMVSHVDDMQYLYDIVEFGWTEIKDKELNEFSKNWVSSWVSFAENGFPKSWGSDYNMWPPLDNRAAHGSRPFKWFHLNKNPKTKTEVFSKRMDFWEELDKEYDFFNTKNKGNKDEL